MKLSATRRLQYSIGHRVFQHETKCKHLHGHNFIFFLTAESSSDSGPDGLDSRGRVIDFGVLKEKFDSWFTTNWDHGLVLWSGDDEALAAARMLPGQKLYLLNWNPTAENLARFVLTVLGPQLLQGTGVVLTKVEVQETENGIAEALL
jgi:6-pyruvoyltetrahydropterin/6-carboxytetrahydropterin synthase